MNRYKFRAWLKQEMVGYKFKHYKNGKIYLVLDIVIHTETQELMVVYRNINDEQIWCRPLSIFNEEIDNEHHKRFVKIDDDSDWKNQQEQAIFKEFEKLGYEYFKLEKLNYIGVFKNDDEQIFIDLANKFYEKTDRTEDLHPVMMNLQEHQLLNRLFEIWGFFDE